ncbi:MAG: DegT/DnrJ/EryC1/StrS family aminotransferase [Anaerolineaceae bacterium]|nr:DegT/DnrJ/EryC1/StrS family aminotransferase [Anaerolineaceae bacterium]
MGKTRYLVPMSCPDLNDEDRQAVIDVLQTSHLSMGPKIEAFEEAVAKYTGARHALGVSSGTTGLHLCVRAADIQPGDYVITSPFSFVSSTNVLLFENAVPVFVDVDPKTGNIDPDKVKQAVNDLKSGNEERTTKWLPRKGAGKSGKLKGLLAVDVFGQPVDYDNLEKITRDNNLFLIEDSCEAMGAEYKHRKAGLFGDFGVFAFYPNKQMTTGEGGMVITNKSAAADLMRALRNQGRAPGDNWLQHTLLGYNYRLNEMSAALGASQMQRIDELISKRETVAQWYNTNLKGIDGVEIPYVSPATTRMSWFVYVIRIGQHFNRDRNAAKMDAAGIPVRPYFLPIHLQPYMVDRFDYKEGDYPITEDLGRRSLALPFSGLMTEDQVKLVCDKLKTCLCK